MMTRVKSAIAIPRMIDGFYRALMQPDVCSIAIYVSRLEAY